jgi:electron transfer flavoprotein alpha subunit
MGVLALLDHDRGSAPDATWEALTGARRVAESLGTSLEALAIGTDDLTTDAGTYGAQTVHVARHDLLTDYGPEAWGATLALLAERIGASAVIGPGTERGHETLAHAAARLDLPMVANAISIEPGDPWRVTRVRWGGSLLEHTELSSSMPALTVAAHAIEATDEPVDAEVLPFAPELPPELGRTVVVERETVSEGMTLATAPVVIGGGRGVGSAEGFAVLEDLAGLLDGVVGCSRVVTNNGWRPHRDQVGQTGTKIAPTVYVACGISGAIQHWVGAAASKHVIAINTDPEANMVAKADYAVIGDLHEIVPAVAEEIRRRR